MTSRGGYKSDLQVMTVDCLNVDGGNVGSLRGGETPTCPQMVCPHKGIFDSNGLRATEALFFIS